MKQPPNKWRPTLGMVVTIMLVFILCLPITGIWAFRFYDSQLVRETEQELIVQAAFIEAIVIDKLESAAADENILGSLIPETASKSKAGRSELIEAKLDLSSNSILPPRQDPVSISDLPANIFISIGNSLNPILAQSQRKTLAGFRVLDPNGVIIAGRSELGQSLAHVYEVKEALEGNYASVIRQRISDSPPPPIYAISRGTGIRVFVAMPILYENRIAGVAYLSRTPSHFLRELYDLRWKIALAVISMLLVTFIIGYVFIRTIKGPIEALNDRTNRISKGDQSALEPLAHHGTRELASLSENLLSMSRQLRERSDYISTFATHVSHELKSPLTSIQGAAELLRDSAHEMSEENRNRFISNIMGDTERLTKLVERLRDLAQVDNSDHRGSSNLKTCLARLDERHPDLSVLQNVDHDIMIGLTRENSEIVFSNLLTNAIQHGASEVRFETVIEGTDIVILVKDNGEGISELNRDKIFQLFFTTKREDGGTGMGLGIIQSVLKANGGSISVEPSEQGACFKLRLPFIYSKES